MAYKRDIYSAPFWRLRSSRSMYQPTQFPLSTSDGGFLSALSCSESALVSLLTFLRSLNPPWEPHLWDFTYFSLSKTPSPNPVILEVRRQNINLGGNIMQAFYLWINHFPQPISSFPNFLLLWLCLSCSWEPPSIRLCLAFSILQKLLISAAFSHFLYRVEISALEKNGHYMQIASK